MDEIDSFGEWLRQRRIALRLTQTELANGAACSVSALRKIEADQRRPSHQLAELLAGCLDIPAEARPLFLDAARGRRPVARLGAPTQALAPAPPAAARPTGPAWNLPTPATPLLGRQAELATLAELLADPACRLLTIVGPGGIGKTRLAIEAACNAWDRFPDGVYFASLAPISAPEFMVSAMAQAVGLHLAGPAEPRSQLVSYLSRKRALLLLDNLEHLMEGLEEVIALLAGAPGLQLLVTSRERLELSGEWVFEVQGLPYPAEGKQEELEAYSAVQLFLQRARQAQVDFEPAAEEYPDVVRICRLLGGMPLAIEMAASWVPVLSCAEIAAEIAGGLDILTTTRRDVDERHRSMRAVFDHSWRFLADEERQLARALSVFRGGFLREAAEDVAGADLTLLSALVAKSFLRRSAAGRYSLHELVRQYVADRLAEVPEEEVAARDRHSAYYTDFVAGLEGELKGAGQLPALAAMDAEIDNIRAGWRWAVRRGALAAVRKPLRALWYYFEMHAWFQESGATFGWAAVELDRQLGRDDALGGDAQALREYLRALQGWSYVRRGTLEQARLPLETSLAAFQSLGISIELADVLYYAGVVAWLSGDYGRARDLCSQQLAVAEQVGSLWDVGLATGNLALALQALGEYTEAEQRFQAALAINRQLGEQRMEAVALHFLGRLKRALGAYDAAEACFRESMALSRHVGERWIYAMALSELGAVTDALGDHGQAIRLLNESLPLLRELGEYWGTLHALMGLGAAAWALGDYAESRAAYGEALAIAWEKQALPEVMEAAAGLARWLAGHGRAEQALATALLVLDHPAASEQTRTAARRLRPELEARLAPEQIEGAQEAAEALSPEDLVASLLAPDPS